MEWKISPQPVAYGEALRFMDERAAAIHAGAAAECIWLLEHPPLYTAGTSAKDSDLLDPRLPVFATGRGGAYTYHGPGQRVVYVMLNLQNRQQTPDIKRYIRTLEEWIIRTLAVFAIAGERRAGRVGIWVVTPDGAEKKIAAIGVRVRRWVSLHGFSLNVHPNLAHFAGIVPCGIAEHGVTSMAELGADATMDEVDAALRRCWGGIFI